MNVTEHIGFDPTRRLLLKGVAAVALIGLA